MKKKLVRVSEVIVNVLMVMTIMIRPVKAYIDPSAVTYVIQAVAGVVIAIGALLTIFRHKIVAIFKKNKDVEKKEVHFKEDEPN